MSELLSYKGTVDYVARRTGLVSQTGYQTNSSTFGTLLSSQGSSAHLSEGLSAWLGGNLVKLTGRVRPSQIGSAPRSPGASTSIRAVLRPTVRALSPPRMRCSVGGLASGRPPGLSALRPAAPWRRDRTLGGSPGIVKSAPCGAGHKTRF